MHAGALVERVLTFINDPEGIRYGLEQIIKLLNDAQADFLRKTKTTLRGRATLSADLAGAGAEYFPVPADMYVLEHVELEGDPLTKITEAQAARTTHDWSNRTGTPEAYMYGRYGRSIRLYPDPVDPVQPVIDYIRRPADLGVAQESELDPNDAIALAHYAAAWVLMNDDELADPSKATAHKAEYEGIVATVRGDLAHNMVRTARTVRRGKF